MFCRQCGARNEAGSRFCEACGAKMVIHGVHGNTYRSSTSKNRKKLFVIWFGALLFVAVLLVGWFFIGFQNTRAFNDAMDEGNRYLLAENLEQAEAHFLRAIEINPREVEPYLQLAEIYMTLDEPEEAIAILEQGLEAVPEEAQGELGRRLNEINEIITRENEEETSDDEPEVRDASVGFVWVLEPSIEADDINYVVYIADLISNVNRRQFPSPHAVIRRGNTFGLIDYHGNIEGGMYFEYISLLAGTYLLQLIEPREYDGWEIWTYLWTGEEFEPLPPRGGDGAGGVIFYYYNGLEFIMTGAYAAPPRESIQIPNAPIPVLRANRSFHNGNIPETNWDQWSSEWYDEQEGLYGIFYQGEMITDFIFTSTGSWLDGAIAVEQNGRWGYLNERGEVIIPIEFDSSWRWDTYDWRQNEFVRLESAFAASEGFIPLVRDGVWEMRDITGATIIEPGVFQEIRPVNGGRSWVKYDGLWGVIEIVGTIETERGANVFQEVGEGENTFLFEVIDDEGLSHFWIISTNHTTVGEALVELDLIRGEETQFGLFVTEVDGLVADFDDGGAWWAFYVDGEIAMTSVTDTEIEPNITYGFVFTRD